MNTRPGNNNGPYWTPQDDITITRMFADGCSVQDIADALGRSYGAVVERRKRIGVPPHKRGKKLTQDEVNQIIELALDGNTATHIAKQIGRSWGAVYKHMENYGLVSHGSQRTPRKWTDDQDDTLRALAEHNVEVREIARALVKGVDDVKQRMRILGLA